MRNPCGELQDKIADFVLGILSPEENDVLQEHISTCSGCREYRQALEGEKNLIRQFVQTLDAGMKAREDRSLQSPGRSVSSLRPTPLSVWSELLQNRTARLTAAAAIIIAVLIGAKLFIGPGEKPTEPDWRAKLVEAEKKQIEQMYAAGDVTGLAAMLSRGQFASKVLAAQYLGEIGDAGALPQLQKLYLSAEAHLPQGYAENPFAEPIEKIKSRIKPESDKGRVQVDANDTGKAGDGTERIAVPAHVAAVLDLAVVHKETRVPVASVKLTVNIDGKESEDVTDEQGRCRIQLGSQKHNWVLLHVSKEGFVPMRIAFRKDKEDIRIPQSYTLALEPGTSIGGLIQNEQGQPIEGVAVYLLVSTSDETGIERVWILDHMVKTDANGFWRCDIMPAKLDQVYFRLAHPDYIGDDAYGLNRQPPMERLRDMTSVMVMRKGLTVTGRVVDANGRPVEGAVVAQGSSRLGTHYPSTKTDADGKFSFGQSSPGEMILTVQAAGYAPELKEIMAHEGMPPIEFYLGPGQTIRGRVVDSNDSPIEGVFVSVVTWRGRRSLLWHTNTDSRGYFRWNDAPTDEVRLGFQKTGYLYPGDIPLSSAVDEYVIVMCRPLRVSGQVLDADSKTPITNFRLIPGTKSDTGGSVVWQRGQAMEFTRSRYEYEFPFIADGYAIRVEAAGYQPGMSAVFDAGKQGSVFDFELKKGQPLINGTVHLPDGEPAAGAEVALFTPEQGVSIRNGEFFQKKYMQIAQTDADGRFSFAGETGPYFLAAVAEQGYAEITSEQLGAAGRITLQPWGRIEGVVCLGGKPGADETVWLVREKVSHDSGPARLNYDYHTKTDSQGRFVLERVVPGRARLAHEKRRTGLMVDGWVQPVEVTSGQTLGVTVGGAGRPIVGRVAVPADYRDAVHWASAYHGIGLKLPEPPRPDNFSDMTDEQKRAWHKAWQDSDQGKAFQEMQWQKGRFCAVYIEHDGTFRIEDVPAGTYSLQIHMPVSSTGASRRPGDLIGSLHYQFEVPEMLEGKSDKPLDIGTLQLQIKSPLTVGDFAPSFEVETFDGKKINLADYRGKTLLLSIWRMQDASMQQLLQVEEIYRSFSKDGQLVMIALSLDDNLEAAREFVTDRGLKSVNCVPTERSRVILSEQYGVTRVTYYGGYDRLAFPHTLVIGPQGKILSRNPSPEQLELLLGQPR